MKSKTKKALAIAAGVTAAAAVVGTSVYLRGREDDDIGAVYLQPGSSRTWRGGVTETVGPQLVNLDYTTNRYWQTEDGQIGRVRVPTRSTFYYGGDTDIVLREVRRAMADNRYSDVYYPAIGYSGPGQTLVENLATAF